MSERFGLVYLWLFRLFKASRTLHQSRLVGLMYYEKSESTY